VSEESSIKIVESGEYSVSDARIFRVKCLSAEEWMFYPIGRQSRRLAARIFDKSEKRDGAYIVGNRLAVDVIIALQSLGWDVKVDGRKG
jgi:hypothetical protein